MERPYWYILDKKSAFRKGKLYGFKVHDFWIVCFKKDCEKLIALEDKCLHRCTPLSKGFLIGNSIQCPYHGWRFNQDGDCIEIPANGSDRIHKFSKKIRTFYTIDKNDYYYVWLGETKPTTDPFNIPFYKKSGWQSIKVKNYFQTNLENCLENFLDIPHTAFVHPGIFRKRTNQKLSASIVKINGSLEVSYAGERGNLGWFSKILNRKKQPIEHFDRFFPPNITSVEYRFPNGSRFFITSQSIAIDSFKKVVFTDLTYNYGWWGFLAKPIIKLVAQRIINQDKDILKHQGQALEKYGDDFLLTTTDSIGVQVRNVVRAIDQGRMPNMSPNKKQTIEFWV